MLSKRKLLDLDPDDLVQLASFLHERLSQPDDRAVIIDLGMLKQPEERAAKG